MKPDTATLGEGLGVGAQTYSMSKFKKLTTEHQLLTTPHIV